MTCPRCSVANISEATGACELCGFVAEGGVAVEVPHPDATDQVARLQLAHEFRIDVLLGHGQDSHSAVYLAREKHTAGYCVLKVLPRRQDRDPQADERFRRACEMARTLDHPHIVPIRRFGTTDSLFWYTMEHVRARSVREILRSRGPLELKTCQRIVAQIASALDYAHRRGVVHGNIKPENVLIDPNGWVHVCDALITRALERPTVTPGRPTSGHSRPKDGDAETSRPSRTSVRAATPPDGPTRGARTSGDPKRSLPAAPSGPASPAAPRKTPEGMPSAGAERRPDYLAPEDHAAGQRTQFADQYALAALIYECLTGTTHSAGADTYEPPNQLASVRPDLPAHLTHAVRRAMSQRPGDRYPSILDFAMALESGALALTDSHPSGRASELVLTVPGWTPPPRRYPRWLFALVGLALIAFASWYLSPRVKLWQQRRAYQASERGTRTTAVTPPADSAPAAQRPVPPGSTATAHRERPPTHPEPREERGSRPPATPSRTRQAPAAAPVAPADPGRLFVNASPWGQVYLDGQPIGNTPRANFPVAAGSHALRVVREGFSPFERQITVGSGETVRITDIVLAPRP